MCRFVSDEGSLGPKAPARARIIERWVLRPSLWLRRNFTWDIGSRWSTISLAKSHIIWMCRYSSCDRSIKSSWGSGLAFLGYWRFFISLQPVWAPTFRPTRCSRVNLGVGKVCFGLQYLQNHHLPLWISEHVWSTYRSFCNTVQYYPIAADAVAVQYLHIKFPCFKASTYFN